MTHAWAKAASVTGTARGWTRNRAMPAARNGTTWAIVVVVQRASVRRRRCASTRGRQWTAASSGSGSAAMACLPAGDRQAHDHEVGVDRQLADLLGLPLPRGHHREVPAIELLAERPHRGLDGLGVVRAPLGQR